MRQLLCFFLIAVLLVPVLGCSSASFDPVTFYYCRKPEEYLYFESDGVIASEGRDLTGHNDDLQYLIALYLAGPLDEELISPFPRKTRLVQAQKDTHSVYIELSDLGSTMTDAEYSLATACLAKTCMPFAAVDEVTIRSGARTITINAENIILFDSAITENTEGEQK